MIRTSVRRNCRRTTRSRAHIETGPGVGPLGAQFYNEMAGVTGAPTLTQLRANAKADFEAATYGVTDPGKIRDAMKRAITDNLPDPAVSNPHGAFGPTAKPTALPTDFPRLNPGEWMRASAPEYGNTF